MSIPNPLDGNHPINPAPFEEQPASPPNAAQPVKVDPYYTDTISSAKDQLDSTPKPKQSLLEVKIHVLSQEFDDKLLLESINVERLNETIKKLIQALGKRQANNDQEQIQEYTVQIKIVAVKIQGTYNNLAGKTITVVAAVVGIVGGAGGLTPLVPVTFIPEGVSNTLATAAHSLSNSSTAISGLASIFNNQEEGKRQVLQIDLKTKEQKKDHKESSKQHEKETSRDAGKAAESTNQTFHSTFTEMAR